MTLLDHFAENLSRHGDPAKAAAQLGRSAAWGGGTASRDPRRAGGAGGMTRLNYNRSSLTAAVMAGRWHVGAFALFAGYAIAGAYDGLPLPKFRRGVS